MSLADRVGLRVSEMIAESSPSDDLDRCYAVVLDAVASITRLRAGDDDEGGVAVARKAAEAAASLSVIAAGLLMVDESSRGV